MIYIQKEIKENYVEFNFKLDHNYLQGTTYDDYNKGYWIPLNKNQIEFKNSHPNASIKEVIEMRIDAHLPSLEEAKFEKLLQVERYDTSTEVNEFYYKDKPLEWLIPQERLAIKERFIREKDRGVKVTHLYRNGIKIDVTPSQGIAMINMLNDYADICYDVTETHKANIKALNTIEEVIAYNYKTGYPKKLRL